MVLPYVGGGRVPGAIGHRTGTMSGHVPGPLGFKQVDLSKGNAGATKATRSVGMPPPWKNFDAKRVAVVNWQLVKGKPQPEDIKQGGLPNCPVGAILAALAHTAVGQKYLDGLVTEFDGIAIKTLLSPEVIAEVGRSTSDDPDYRPQMPELVSQRYFTTPIWKGEIPDTFYIHYTDGTDTQPEFMDSPNEVLWPLVIEKACAYHFGSYNELGMYTKHDVNEHWKLIMGVPPAGGFEVRSSTNLDKIREAADGADRVPTVAASRPGVSKVTPMHGFAVLGMAGSEIELYDAHGMKVRLSLEDFRDNFQTILSGNPS
jgi:hypothetical protein